MTGAFCVSGLCEQWLFLFRFHRRISISLSLRRWAFVSEFIRLGCYCYVWWFSLSVVNFNFIVWTIRENVVQLIDADFLTLASIKAHWLFAHTTMEIFRVDLLCLNSIECLIKLVFDSSLLFQTWAKVIRQESLNFEWSWALSSIHLVLIYEEH